MPRPAPLALRLVPLLLLAAVLAACSSDAPLPYQVYRALDGLEPLLQAARLAFALAGLALLLAGWKIYRFVVALPGFLIGAVLGAGLGYAGAESWLLAVLGLLIGGVLGAALALFLHDVAIFLIGALIGGLLFGLLFAGFSDSGFAVLAAIVGGIAGGVALLALSRLWIVILSAIVGACLFGLAITSGPGWMVLFCLAGMGIQYGLAAALGESLPAPWKRSEEEEAPSPPQPQRQPPPVTEPEAQVDAPPVEPLIEPPVASPPPKAAAGVAAAGAAAAVFTPTRDPVPGPPAAVLVSKDNGEMYRIEDGSRVGRGSGCDVWLRDRSVSRKHARFRHAQGSWFLQDEGSTLGTFVNGQRIEATRLQAGDQIRIADLSFTFDPGTGL